MIKISKGEFKKGSIVRYNKEIMFKGIDTIKSKIVAIFAGSVLMDNGDEFRYFNSGNDVFIAM